MDRTLYAAHLEKALVATTKSAMKFSLSHEWQTPPPCAKYLGYLTLHRAYALLTSLPLQLSLPFLPRLTLVSLLHTHFMQVKIVERL